MSLRLGCVFETCLCFEVVLKKPCGYVMCICVSSAKAPMVSYSEETALANAQNWHELDRATRDKLYRRFGRAALPPSAATEWAAARSDRSGRRQIAFLKLYLKDPTFGSLTVKEAQKVEDSSSNSTLWRWESEDDLLVRYAFLPREERVEKVKEEMASATKKMKHPTKKGEFIYRFWRGTTESDSSVSSKKRTLSFEVPGLAFERQRASDSSASPKCWLSNRIRPRLRSVGIGPAIRG